MAFYDNHYSNFFRIIIFIKGLSKNYVATNVGMKSTRFSALAQTLFSSESSRTLKFNQTTAELSFGWVFGVQLDSQEKSVSANAEKRVDFIPTFVAT